MPETAEARSNASGVKQTATQFWLPAAIIAVGCAFFAFFVISRICLTSATYDETSHLPSGYAYLAWHDFRMNPEHPPLIKKLAAFPLLFRQVLLCEQWFMRWISYPVGVNLFCVLRKLPQEKIGNETDSSLS
jgi:hypothetical protein